MEVLSSLGERLMACKEEADHVMVRCNSLSWLVPLVL